MAATLTTGAEAPVKEVKLTRTDLVQYAGASGDYNPMHHDEILAGKANLPSVFGHGMLSMGILGGALTDFVGVQNLTSYSVRFVKQTWPDEVLRTKVVVASVEGGVATLDCSLENADGEVKVTGQATAKLA
jgi:acyl dehydratase